MKARTIKALNAKQLYYPTGKKDFLNKTQITLTIKEKINPGLIKLSVYFPKDSIRGVKRQGRENI